VPAPEVRVLTLDRPLREFSIPFGVSALHLSPGGRSIAAVAHAYNARATVHVGRAGGTMTAIDADGALFIDDDRVLVWTVDGSRTDLREVVLAAPEAAGWQLHVTGLSTPAVSIDPASRRWRLGSRTGLGELETREGVVGTEEITRHRWSVPDRSGSPVAPVSLSGDRALAIEARPDLPSRLADPFSALVFVFASGPRWRSTLWALGPEGAGDLGTSRLEVACHAMPLGDRGLCHVFDASRTRFFAMDARTRAITAVASLPGRFFAGEDTHGDWITGWHQSALLAVRLSPLAAVRVVGPDGAAAHVLAASDRVAAGVWYQAAPASSLGVEPMYQATGSSLVRIYAID
jgi:hypothetical protein